MCPGYLCDAGEFDPLSKNCTVSATGRKIMKPYCILCCISPRINPKIYGVHDDAWVPLARALSRDSLDQGGPVFTNIPSST